MNTNSSRYHAKKNRPSGRRKKALLAAQCRLGKKSSESNPNEPSSSNLPDNEEGTYSQDLNSQVPTTSTKKLDIFSHIAAGENVETVPSEYLLVHKSVWGKLLENVKCGECNSNVELQMRENKGFATKLVIKCLTCGSNCGKTYSSPQITSRSQRPPFDINKKMVDAFITAGVGYSCMQTFSSVVGIKGMSMKTYQNHFQSIMKGNELQKQAVLARSHRAVRQAHVDCDQILATKDVIDITVSYDGTWHKRGHTSQYGVGLVIDVLTGLVVDFEVLSKFCHMCSFAITDLGQNSPEFHFWFEEHKKSGECRSNYSGSSNALEMVGAERLWSRSVENCKLRYTTVLSDGDSKTYQHLSQLAVYGPQLVIKKRRMHQPCRKANGYWP